MAWSADQAWPVIFYVDWPSTSFYKNSNCPTIDTSLSVNVLLKWPHIQSINMPCEVPAIGTMLTYMLQDLPVFPTQAAVILFNTQWDIWMSSAYKLWLYQIAISWLQQLLKYVMNSMITFQHRSSWTYRLVKSSIPMISALGWHKIHYGHSEWPFFTEKRSS